MQIYSTYKVKIKHYNNTFKDTVIIYRNAVDFIIQICIDNWDNIISYTKPLEKQRFMDLLIHNTKQNTAICEFDKKFYKLPCYLRRTAINEAIGKVSSYKSNLANWELNPIKKAPSTPKAGFIYPAMYKTVMYEQISKYQARIKVYIRNTWDWLIVNLRKSDIDYIAKHCDSRNHCVPILQK